jgi:hypothetical protein
MQEVEQRREQLPRPLRSRSGESICRSKAVVRREGIASVCGISLPSSFPRRACPLLDRERESIFGFMKAACGLSDGSPRARGRRSRRDASTRAGMAVRREHSRRRAPLQDRKQDAPALLAADRGPRTLIGPSLGLPLELQIETLTVPITNDYRRVPECGKRNRAAL